jgi:hypothetical protein
MGVTLRAEADDRDLLALDDREIGVVVVEDLSHFCAPSIECVSRQVRRRDIRADPSAAASASDPIADG